MYTNTFMNNLQAATNYKYTENMGLAHSSTGSALLDLFALGASYRNRSESDCIALFEKALREDTTYALKCLFYLRDIPGKGNGGIGQGERRFFKVCMNWLAKNHPEMVKRNIENIPYMGRWDDLYCLVDTPCEKDAFALMKKQLALDVQSKTPSLLAKWLKSSNASSKETCRLGVITQKHFGMTPKQYRKTLSILRERINVLERLMSENRWSEIEFDSIPSKAGIKYKNAFARHDIERAKADKQTYEQFAKDANTKVNAATLYPYEIVNKVTANLGWYYSNSMSETDRNIINKYWQNQKDYLNGAPCKMICVCDTSGSMCGTPIDIAISLSMYCAERLSGPFANTYISFASRPQLINIVGKDFVDKVQRIYRTNLCDNTNLEAVFDLLKNIALKSKPEDMPDTIVVLSDMEIDAATRAHGRHISERWTKDNASTMMESIRRDWARYGLKLPRLVYWNCDARNDTILDLGENVSYVSGSSPSIFTSVLTGKSQKELMYDVLNKDRYKNVK